MTDHYHGNSQPQGKGYAGGSGGPYGYANMHVCNMSRAYIDLTDEERKCLEERKYWCFLLSRFVISLFFRQEKHFSI